jgi:hypothetical protein
MSSTVPRLPALAEAPPSSLRGRRYGEDRLYLLVRDPRTVMALWELVPSTHERAQGIARERRAPLRYQIRIERRADEKDPPSSLLHVDVPDALQGERWYATLPRPGGECRAMLGLVLPDGFEALLVSSWVPVPPDGPCAEIGAWDLTPEARAWLEEHARAARGGEAGGRFGYIIPSGSGRL